MRASSFDARKRHTQLKNDKSRKGSVDASIASLVEEINLHEDFYTTSSCSGRVSLFGEPTELSKASGKKGGQWIYSSHQPPSSLDLSHAVFRFLGDAKNQERLNFRFEPFILACECRSLEAARKLVQVGLEAGFRESGIVLGSDKHTVTIRSATKLEIPICEQGALLVPESYLDFLTTLSVGKFQNNNSKIDHFQTAFHKVFSVKQSSEPTSLTDNQPRGLSSDFYSMDLEWEKMCFESLEDQKVLSRWGHSVCLVVDDIVLFGGYGGCTSHQRLNDIVCLNTTSKTVYQPPMEGDIPCPRMHHASVVIGKWIYIIGGRTHPKNPLNDVFELDIYFWSFKKLPCTLPGRFRHTALVYGDHQIVVFGGAGVNGPLNDLWILNTVTEKFECFFTKGRRPSPRMSHGSCIINDSLFVHGGFADYNTIFSDLFQLDLKTFVWTEIITSQVSFPPLLSHCLVSLGDGILCVLGRSPKSQDNRIHLVNTNTAEVRVLNVAVNEKESWVDVRQQAVFYKNTLYLIGGGAFCFSFGTIFSSTFLMDLTNLRKVVKSPLVRRQDSIQLDANVDLLHGVVVSKDHAKKAKDVLKKLGLLNAEYSSSVFEYGAKIAFPLTSEGAKVFWKSARLPYLDVQLVQGLDCAEEVESSLQELIVDDKIVLQEVEFAPSKRKLASTPPGERLKHMLRNHLAEIGLEKDERLLKEMPEKWERLGDLALLPESSILSKEWFLNSSVDIWKKIASALNCHRLARQASISKSENRSPRCELLLGNNGIVQHRENGILYSLDITKSMFSSGNVSERIRMSKVECKEEIIVDLYAGIGYYTIPMLLKAHPKKVYACEWNRHAIKALRLNLESNGVGGKCEVLEGDCRKLAPSEVADRVLLGLLPSSQGGWKTALAALRPTGGWLHLHENIKDTEEDEWIRKTVGQLVEWAKELGKEWVISVEHCEHVKWYAPHIRHIVLDLYCQPSQPPLPISSSNSNQSCFAVKSDLMESPESSSKTTFHTMLTKEQFWNEVVICRKPVIFKGLDLGRATDCWNAEYLSSHQESSNRLVSAHVCTDPQGRMNFVHKNFTFHTMPLKELIERCAHLQEHKPIIRSEEYYYLRSIGENPRKEKSWIHKSFPSLSQDFKLPEFLEEERLFSTVLRVSSPGLQLWTHFDVMDNLLIQPTGTKIVRLWPPSQEPYLYIKGSSSELVDIENPDLQKYPKFAEATGLFEWRLEPGDVLYIPALWFHNVKSVDFSVSINAFFHHLPTELYDKKDLYGNRDLLPVQQVHNLKYQMRYLLNQLPEDFRQFYGGRLMRDLAESLKPK